jgi:hypothetical protein
MVCATPNGGKQMNINYTYNENASGIDIIVDLECDLECSVSYDYGDLEPDVTIDSVTIFSGDVAIALMKATTHAHAHSRRYYRGSAG